jgi:hypothetical protein
VAAANTSGYLGVGRHPEESEIQAMSIHFKFEIVPAERWSRLIGTMPAGKSNEPRPHLIPVSEIAQRLVKIDALGLIGRTGLCPGTVILEDGSTTTAYRFIDLSPEGAESLIQQLDEQIEQLQRSCE